MHPRVSTNACLNYFCYATLHAYPDKISRAAYRRLEVWISD